MARLRRTVALIGLMGAGKSTVGRRLAETLGAPFRDSDDEIAAAAGMEIPEIFAELGEPAFRLGERRVIARLLEGPPHVLATGGGAFMEAETRALIRARAVSVWIRAELDTLVERTGRRGDRPLLKSGDPREILARLMTLRHPVYAEADVVVESRAGGSHEEVAAAIVEALRARGVVEGDAPRPRGGSEGDAPRARGGGEADVARPRAGEADEAKRPRGEGDAPRLRGGGEG